MVNSSDTSQQVQREIGKVITFYSYKGGVGRSMALANVAALVAKWGKKALIIDWDLEAPGLENFYRKFLNIPQVALKEGIIDLLTSNDHPSGQDGQGTALDLNRYTTQLEGQLSCLWIMTSGKKDENYVARVRSFNISKFFEERDGGRFLEELRNSWIREFDFVFIDSRTGLTDSSGVCSIHMPDVLVLLFTPNEQSFRGSMEVAEKAAMAHSKLIYDRLKLKLFPIPTRIENNESARREEWLDRFARDLTPVFNWLPRRQEDPSQFSTSPREIINHIKVPYIPEYAYGEQLPAIEKGTSDPQDIGWVYESIAAIISNSFDNLDFLRSSRDQYIKKAKGEEIVDHSDFERKIAIEREEKKALEDSMRLRASKVKKNYRIVGLFIILVLGVGGYMLLRPKSIDDLPPDVKNEAAYQAFASAFSDSAKAKKNTTLDILTLYNNYFSLAPSFREKASAFKKVLDSNMQVILSDKIQTVYKSLSDSSYSLTLFADTLAQFDSSRNIAARGIFTNSSYLAYLAKQRNKLRQTNNAGLVTIHSFRSDSAMFSVEFSENAYSIFPEQEKMQGPLAQLVFNYDLKITTAAPVSMPVQLITPPIIDSARVYILAGTNDTSYFGPLRDDLRSAGFAVLGARYLVDVGRPDKPELRYFHMEDKDQAVKLAVYMRAKIGNTSFSAEKYTDARARPGYIEIWLGR